MGKKVFEPQPDRLGQQIGKILEDSRLSSLKVLEDHAARMARILNLPGANNAPDSGVDPSFAVPEGKKE